MSHHSSDFFKEHPVLGGIFLAFALVVAGGVKYSQARGAFNEAVAMCKAGQTPRLHRKPIFASKTARQRIDMENTGIRFALNSEECRRPRW